MKELCENIVEEVKQEYLHQYYHAVTMILWSSENCIEMPEWSECVDKDMFHVDPSRSKLNTAITCWS